jgi:hypothetical protein
MSADETASAAHDRFAVIHISSLSVSLADYYEFVRLRVNQTLAMT